MPADENHTISLVCEASRDFDGDDVRESKVKEVRHGAPDSEWVTAPPNAGGE